MGVVDVRPWMRSRLATRIFRPANSPFAMPQVGLYLTKNFSKPSYGANRTAMIWWAW